MRQHDRHVTRTFFDAGEPGDQQLLREWLKMMLEA
jgi:hypothetical protein